MDFLLKKQLTKTHTTTTTTTMHKKVIKHQKPVGGYIWIPIYTYSLLEFFSTSFLLAAAAAADDYYYNA